MKNSSTITTLSVLERIDAADDSLSATLSKSEFRILRELDASSYIEGQIGPSTHDSPDTMVEDVRLTTKGRMLMDRLRREKKAQSFWAVTWRWLGPVLGFVAGGIVSPVVVAYLKKRYGL